MKIIDCHAHFGHFAPTAILATGTDSMLRAMDRAQVDQLCISSFLGIGPDSRTGNDLVAAATGAHPDRFLGYATINPNRPSEVIPELERCFERPGFRAIKLHPALHQYPISGPAYRKALEFASARRLLVLSHEWGPPELLESLSAEFPETSFLMAHTGFWNARGEFPYAGVFHRRANVFVDLAYSNIYYDALELLTTQVSPAKILWGSDFPLHDLSYQLGRVLFSRLDEPARRQILGGNLERLLALSAAA